MTTAVLILATGQGIRAGAKIPKQYVELPGGSALSRSIRTFIQQPEIGFVCVTISPSDRHRYDRTICRIEGSKLLPPVEGGFTRQASALAGLRRLQSAEPGKVLIHDAARPFVGRKIIASVLNALDRVEGVIPVLELSDTIWQVGQENACVRTHDRNSLRRAQTPQGFCFKSILAAHERQEGANLGDDADVAVRAGMKVLAIAGDPENRKLTTETDMSDAIRTLALGSNPFRVGQGIDVHAFGPGDSVRLCAVSIPHGRGLTGHSDADAGLHALADAIFGALGAGDIGEHFPDSDPRWRGSDSRVFVQYAKELAENSGFRITHVDITLICEEPKIAAYREEMRRATAKMLHLNKACVSIKATTSERHGFVGRGEGIAAFALATLWAIGG